MQSLEKSHDALNRKIYSVLLAAPDKVTKDLIQVAVEAFQKHEQVLKEYYQDPYKNLTDSLDKLRSVIRSIE